MASLDTPSFSFSFQSPSMGHHHAGGSDLPWDFGYPAPHSGFAVPERDSSRAAPAVASTVQSVQRKRKGAFEEASVGVDAPQIKRAHFQAQTQTQAPTQSAAMASAPFVLQNASKKRERSAFEASSSGNFVFDDSTRETSVSRAVKRRTESSHRDTRANPTGAFQFALDISTMEERRKARGVLGKRKLNAFDATSPELDREKRDAWRHYDHDRSRTPSPESTPSSPAAPLPAASSPPPQASMHTLESLSRKINVATKRCDAWQTSGGESLSRTHAASMSLEDSSLEDSSVSMNITKAAARPQGRKGVLAEKRFEAWQRANTLSRTPAHFAMSGSAQAHRAEAPRQELRQDQEVVLDLDAAVKKSELDQARQQAWLRLFPDRMSS